MKAKLLKIVRRRYEIFKVIKLEKDAPNFLLEANEEIGTPFYYLIDNRSEYRATASKSFEALKGKMIQWINYDYVSKVKGKKRIEEKVWYNS